MLEKLILAGRQTHPSIDQRVINLGKPGVVGARLSQAGVPVESLGMALTAHSVLQLYRLSRKLRTGSEKTIVQTWLWHADLIGGLCARLAGNRRVVWNLRNSMPGHLATKRASRAVARVCGLLSGWVPAKIICNSSAALRTHVAMGYDAKKFIVIPNGFDLLRFASCSNTRSNTRASWGAGENDILIGMVARVDPLKDHATFIRAAALVAASNPRTRFVLVGDGVASEREIHDLLAQTGLESRFILNERRDDIHSVMCALDVFCLASRSEGFPNVLGEAMACSTPAVATNVGDVREILHDDGLVAELGNPESLARCINGVLGLGEVGRRALGLRQRAEMEARFDIARIWSTYLDVYAAL